MATLGRLLVALGIDSSDYDAGLDGAAQRASSFGNRVTQSFSKVGDVLASTMKVGIAGLAGSFAAFTSSGLGMNNTMEQVTAKLNAFTKDGAKTAEILEMIKVRAAKTPFEFDAMAESAAALLPVSKASGIGLEQLIEKAEILAASNPAEGLEGAAFALKEAASGDMASIIERFNLPRQRLNELKAQGVPAIEAVGIAMKELGLDTDLVTNLANTASGRWSTFKDTITGVAAKITQPIFDMFSGGLASVNTLIEQATPQLEAFAATAATTLGNALNWIANTVVPALIQGWQDLQPTIATVSDFISGTVVPIITGTVIPALQRFAEFIGANLKPIMVGIGAVILAVVVPALVTFIATMIAAAAPIVAVIAVVAILYKAWSENWGGIQEKTQAVIEFLRPHFDNLVAWLKEYIPVAIEAAKRFFVNVLVPAFNTVVAYVNANVIPVLKQIFEWLKVNVPIAIAAATDFFNNKLVPAFKATYDFIVNSLIPTVAKFIDGGIKILTNVVRILSEVWTNVLVPAFRAAYDYVNTNIMPLFQRFGDFLSVTFGPALKTISDFLSDQFSKAFGTAKGAIDPVQLAIDAVSKAIQDALDWIQRMIDKLEAIHIPPILQQESPSPLEQSILDVGTALKSASSGTVDFNHNVNNVKMPHTTGTGDARSIQINIDARGQEQDLVNKIKNVVKDVIQGDVNSASISVRMSNA